MAALVTRAQICAEALTWERTPVVIKQATKGRGCDCKGLIFGIARELGLPEARLPPAARADYRRADPAQLIMGLEEVLIRIAGPPRPGDVLAMPMRPGERPQHLGILVAEGKLLHARPGTGFVVKVPLGRSRLIDSVWTWPSLGGA